MITNERQYAITKAQAAKFREALTAAPPKGLHPKALKAMRDGTQSQLDELEGQLAEYEALRSGKLTRLEVDSLVGIGAALVKARIARRLTHKALAERMNLPSSRSNATSHGVCRRVDRAVAASGRCAERTGQRGADVGEGVGRCDAPMGSSSLRGRPFYRRAA